MIAKEFTSTASGTLIKDVTCEKCGQQYFYQLARIGTGSASAPFFLGQNSAIEHAQQSAAAGLHAKLQLECDLVPCPHCGHIQQQMIRVLRQHSYRGLIFLSWVIGGVGLLLTAVLALAQWNSHPLRFQTEYIAYVVAAAFFVGFFLLMMLLRTWLLSRQNWLRGLIMLAPPALLPDGPPDAAGNIPLRPVPRAQPDARGKSGEWVTLSLVRFHLPALCCQCLQPSTTVYRTPFKLNANSDSQVPLCQVCARRINRRWWAIFALTILICTAASILIPILSIHSRERDDIGTIVTSIFLGLFATMFAAAIVPGWLTKPHTIRVVDDERGIVRMRFRNPQYTRLLRELVCKIDGVQNK